VLLIDAAARELRHVSLEDALKIVAVLAEKRDKRFDRPAARLVARLCIEHRMGLDELRWALALAERMPADTDGSALTLARLIEGC
jgi:hypothetical protein